MNQNALNQVFFTSSSSKELTYGEILDDVKKYCTTHHSDKLTAEEIRRKQESFCVNLYCSTFTTAPILFRI